MNIDLSNFLSPDVNPLKASSNTKWSGVSHDRQNKLLLTSYDENPSADGTPTKSKLIIVPTRSEAPPQSLSDNLSSFINGTKTNNANEIAFVDELQKKIYILDTSDDTWKTNSFNLYNKDKASVRLTEAQRNEIIAQQSEHPLGRMYIKDGSPIDNPLYLYNMMSSKQA